MSKSKQPSFFSDSFSPTLTPRLYRTAYGPKAKISIHFPAQGRTKQSFKDECDINVIMSRYLKTGVLNFVNRFAPQYSDVSGIDYQEAMYTVAQARSMFQELPAELRARFRNDPGQFLDFVHNPANKAEMAQMGLLTPEAASAVLQATQIPTSVQKAPSAKPDQASTPSGDQKLVAGDQA